MCCPMVCRSSRVAAVQMLAALLAFAVSPAKGQDAGQKKASSNEEVQNTGWVLAHHSWERTLTYDDRLGDWLCSGATMPLRDRVQVLPPVADRYGMFWNKRAASSRDFEITFQYSVMPQRIDDSSEEGAFAFWFSPDNFTASYDEKAVVSTRDWAKGLKDAGLTFLSNKPNFRGVGVLFLSSDPDGKTRPSVSAVIHNGGANLRESDFPESTDRQVGRQQTKYIDWRKKEVEVKIRQDAAGNVFGTLKASKSDPAVEIFRLSAEDMKYLENPAPLLEPTTYFGFTGYTGSKSILEMDMSRVEMRNFDMQSVGEQKQDTQADSSPGDELGADADEWKKVLEDEKKYIDQKSQKEAVERLTALLGNYVENYNKMGEKIKSDLVWLEARMSTLNSDVGGLIRKSEAIKDGSSVGAEAQTVKDHIVGIRAILSKDKGVHDNQFDKVSSLAAVLKERGGDVLSAEDRAKVASVAEQARKLESHISSGTSQTSTLLIILVIAVCGLGIMFLNRMRYYEKKHYF